MTITGEILTGTEAIMATIGFMILGTTIDISMGTTILFTHILKAGIMVMDITVVIITIIVTGILGITAEAPITHMVG